MSSTSEIELQCRGLRDTSIRVRLSFQEKEQFEQLANQSGLGLSEMVRRAVFFWRLKNG